MILHYNWFCIDKRIDHLKWTSNNKNSYYTKELCSRFLHIHVLKNSRILYTFVRAYFAYLLLKNLRTVIVQKLQSVHWLLHIQINHDCIIIENIFNSCLWGSTMTFSLLRLLFENLNKHTPTFANPPPARTQWLTWYRLTDF